MIRKNDNNVAFWVTLLSFLPERSVLTGCVLKSGYKVLHCTGVHNNELFWIAYSSNADLFLVVR